MIWLYIAMGGAAGAVARHGLTAWVHEQAGFHVPWGTFLVNMIGSALIGGALQYLEAVAATPETRGLVTVGLLGAFTTFSTFSYETVVLLEEGAVGRAAAYALGSLLLGVLAAYGGMRVASLVGVAGG